MSRPFPIILASHAAVLLVVSMSAHGQPKPESSKSGIDFERDVQPIFAKHCLKCHGEKKQESSLRLDRRSTLLRGGDIGEPSVVPGKPDESYLIKVVSGDDPDVRMPPEGDLIPKKDLATLRTWIAQGAMMPGQA